MRINVKTASIKNGTKGFLSTGIFPNNHDVFSDATDAPAEVTAAREETNDPIRSEDFQQPGDARLDSHDR